MAPGELKYLSLLIIVLPLLSWMVLGIWGKRFERRTAVSMAISCVSGSLFLGAFLCSHFYTANEPVTYSFGRWISTGGFSVPMGLLLDNLSLLMVLTVTIVAILVLIWTAAYPDQRTYGTRFYSLFSLSIASMLILVLADNYLLMLAGWEGVAISSSLLIGMDYRDKWANAAARMLFISNRVADAALIAGILLLASSPLALEPFGIGRGLEYMQIYGNINNLILTDPGYITAMLPLLNIVCMLFFIGAAGKSAQLLFSVWLQDANMAPAGASALMQSVTMVAAGVYLLVRSHPLLLLSPAVMALIAVLGAITVIYAALIASVQTDIRKILAWSTISQVGYMFLGCGVGAYIPVMFHLVTHAVTKACLVLGAGSIIEGADGESDVRRLGGLKKWMPSTRMSFLLASASMAGFPLTAMFFSKSAILQHVFILPFTFGWNLVAGLLGYLGITLTAFYVFRLFYRIFEGDFRGPTDAKPEDCCRTVTGVLTILAVLSVIAGVIGVPVPGINAIQRSLSGIFSQNVEYAMLFWGMEEVPSLPWIFMAISVLLFFSGYGIARNIYLVQQDYGGSRKIRYRRLFHFFWDELRLREAYDAVFLKPGSWFVSWLWRIFDEEIVDRGIVEGTGRAADQIGKWVAAPRPDYIRIYALYVIIAVTLLVWLASL